MSDWKDWRICGLAELNIPDARGFTVGEGDWPFQGFLVRDAAGVRAFANLCPHQGHRLNLDENDFLIPDGSLISCASHGALFRLEDGACISGPCTGRYLRHLECRVNEGEIWVCAPDRQLELGDL